MGIEVIQRFFKSTVFIFSLCWAPNLIAQESVKDTNLIEKDGRMFYRYVVSPGNTLYQISREYSISVPEIQEFNPQTANGLSIGDTLYILAAEKDKQVIENKMEVDGNFLVHEVQKKQTLYAISKIYGISIADILAVNPEIKKGVREGQLIKIPMKKLKEEKEEEVYLDKTKFISHEVQSKETLYSLSKMYQIPIDSIKQANGGLPEGLKVGQVIAIPKVSIGISAKDSTKLKGRYVVAIILPMFLDLNDTLISQLKMNDKEMVLAKSNVAVQFYQGSLIALDSLKKQGKQFDVRFYDSAKDTAYIENLIEKGAFKDVDLIIGPMYLSTFEQVSTYAKAHKIHIVSPVPQNNKILLGNPYTSKVATSRNVLFKNIGKYVAQLHRNQNVIMVSPPFRADPYSLAFKNEFLAQLQKNGDTVNIKNLKEVKWNGGDLSPIRNVLDDSVFNILVVPSEDQVYVTQLLASLNHIHKKYMFKVIGVDQWLRYTNIDFEYFNNLGVMIPVDGFTDYKSAQAINFIEKFQKVNKTFPEKYAIQGFDITYFYLNQLNKNGSRIEEGLTKTNERLLYFKFNYFKTGIESGYENNSTVLLKYEEFELKEVPFYN